MLQRKKSAAERHEAAEVEHHLDGVHNAATGFATAANVGAPLVSSIPRFLAEVWPSFVDNEPTPYWNTPWEPIDLSTTVFGMNTSGYGVLEARTTPDASASGMLNSVHPEAPIPFTIAPSSLSVALIEPAAEAIEQRTEDAVANGADISSSTTAGSNAAQHSLEHNSSPPHPASSPSAHDGNEDSNYTEEVQEDFPDSFDPAGEDEAPDSTSEEEPESSRRRHTSRDLEIVIQANTVQENAHASSSIPILPPRKRPRLAVPSMHLNTIRPIQSEKASKLSSTLPVSSECVLV